MMYISRFKTITAIGLGLIILWGMIFWNSTTLRRAKQNALFAGSFTVCPREEQKFYTRVRYNLASYQEKPEARKPSNAAQSSPFAADANSDEIPWVDGEARDEVQAAIQKHDLQSDNNVSTLSPQVDVLRSPSTYRDRCPYPSMQILTPENGTLYPPNLCAPYVEWEDPQNNLWQISIDLGEAGGVSTFTTSENRWRFPSNLWAQLKICAANRDATLQIKGIRLDRQGKKTGGIQASEVVHFRVSSDPADNYIVYRSVSPPFSSFKTPDIFIRDIREDKPKLFLSARREYCMNCHTFSSKAGNQGKLGLQVRCLGKASQKLKTYLAVYNLDQKKGFKIQLPFEIQMSTFMAWSPDGNRLAYSANQKVAALKPVLYETQLAGMAASDIAIYDCARNETYLLPGASDPTQLEVYPEWTPDGNSLIFSRAPVGPHPVHLLFDLYILSLAPGSKSPARPIPGASGNGRSNYFPHFSPDGQWLSFCRSDGGDLIRSSSDIYLLSGDLQGEAKRLECNCDYAADSWHSWSSNSRWLVFASKREGGVYAYLYLTHIDEQGRASPAVPLPVKGKPFASFNIPEFIAHSPKVRESDLFEAIRVEKEPLIAQAKKQQE